MSEKITQIIDLVKELSVVELGELVSSFEEEFGVTAAAVAVAGAGAAAGNYTLFCAAQKNAPVCQGIPHAKGPADL